MGVVEKTQTFLFLFQIAMFCFLYNRKLRHTYGEHVLKVFLPLATGILWCTS